MGVLLQAFYWDCPREAGVERGWWKHVTARLDSLRDTGFTALWLPPCSKAASATSMGYDPFDYFDLGEFEKGSVRLGRVGRHAFAFIEHIGELTSGKETSGVRRSTQPFCGLDWIRSEITVIEA
jgi:hypothetical protein